MSWRKVLCLLLKKIIINYCFDPDNKILSL